jgi:hypothetical protein
MNDAEITALLDAHDALVKVVIAGEIPFGEFLAAYDDFPQAYALDGQEATPEELAALRRSRRRIAFHLRVSSAVRGCDRTQTPGTPLMAKPADSSPALPSKPNKLGGPARSSHVRWGG